MLVNIVNVGNIWTKRMNNLVGVRFEADWQKRLDEAARRDFSTRQAIVRKCVAIVLPMIENGVPTAALEAMAGGRKARG